MSMIESAVLDAPRRLLIKGLFGAGKTVTIKEMSRRLAKKADRALVVDEMLYDSDRSISHVLLRGLALALSPESEYANLMNQHLLGLSDERKVTSKFSSDLKGGIPNFIQSSNAEEEGKENKIAFNKMPDDPIPIVRRLISDAVERFPKRRVILVVDDLDKRDPNGVRELLTGCRELIHNPQCSFVFTGHPLGIMRDAYSSAGGIIDREVEVPTMNAQTMRVMVARYLGAGRRGLLASLIEPEFRGDRVEDDDIAPFNEASLEHIIQRSYGLPRVLNIICFNVMVEAAKREFAEIGMPELEVCWRACSDQLRRGVQPDFRDTLELMTQRGEPLSLHSIPDGWFERMGIDRREDLVQQLNHALKSDLLVTKNGQDIALNAILRPFGDKPEL